MIKDNVRRNERETQKLRTGISRELMGVIVDEVFDGAIEDCRVIEEIYSVIKRHENKNTCKSTDEINRLRDALRPFSDVADLFDSETECFSMDDQIQLVVQNEGFQEYHVNSFALQSFYDARAALTKEY